MLLTRTLPGVGYEIVLLMFSSSPNQYTFGPTALKSALSRRSRLPWRVIKLVGTVRDRLAGLVIVSGATGKLTQLFKGIQRKKDAFAAIICCFAPIS